MFCFVLFVCRYLREIAQFKRLNLIWFLVGFQCINCRRHKFSMAFVSMIQSGRIVLTIQHIRYTIRLTDTDWLRLFVEIPITIIIKIKYKNRQSALIFCHNFSFFFFCYLKTFCIIMWKDEIREEPDANILCGVCVQTFMWKNRTKHKNKTKQKEKILYFKLKHWFLSSTENRMIMYLVIAFYFFFFFQIEKGICF